MDTPEPDKRPLLDESYLSTRDHEPYDFYARLDQGKGVQWDSELSAWIVSSDKLCREVMSKDDVVFDTPEREAAVRAKLFGSPRVLPGLKGEEHDRLYRWWLGVFSPRKVVEHRVNVIRPIVAQSIDRFIERGKAEMVDDFAERIPIRVIMRLMDLPWQDDAYVERYRTLNYQLVSALTHKGMKTKEAETGAQDVRETGYGASEEIEEMLAPYLISRQGGEGPDLISQLWANGPKLIEGWNMADMRANTRLMMQAGADTTTYATKNAIYLLTTRPELREKLAGADDATIANFVEELLRLYGPVHFRSREALVDTELGGCPIAKGEAVLPVVAAANRDPARYGCPNDFDLARKLPRDHVAFHFGTHTCVGAALARAELQEAIGAILRRLPDMQLDRNAEPPKMTGWLLRSFAPLNVLFTPGAKVAG